jgi:hypothetical protein
MSCLGGCCTSERGRRCEEMVKEGEYGANAVYTCM